MNLSLNTLVRLASTFATLPVLAAIATVATLATTTTTAHAQPWPAARPIRIIVPFTAGTSSDTMVRLLAEEMAPALKQAVIVENKAGASGMIGADYVAKSPPDGYTLLLTAAAIQAQNQFFFKKQPYDPIADFTPIGRIAIFPFVLAVKSDGPFNSVAELVAYGRNADNKTNFGFAQGTGEVAGASFVRLAKMQAAGVAYKGWPQAWVDLAGGLYSFAIGDLVSSRALVQSGKIKLLAVTSEQKSQLAPNLPTIAAEANIPGYDIVTWTGLVGPAGMPPDIVQKLSSTLNAALAKPELAKRLFDLGVEAAPNTPDEFATWIRNSIEVWRVRTKDAGIEPQ